jgi:hypothetical protein
MNSEEVQSKPLSLRALMTPKVSTVTAIYATTGLFHIAFSTVLPVFYATPIELGGLSLDPPRIGVILAASGVAHGIFQIVFYARLHDYFGARAIHFAGVSSGIPIVILFPVINALARAYGIGLAVWLFVAVQLALTTSLIMCYRMSIHHLMCSTKLRRTHSLLSIIRQSSCSQSRLGRSNQWDRPIVRFRRKVHWASVCSFDFLLFDAGRP